MGYEEFLDLIDEILATEGLGYAGLQMMSKLGNSRAPIGEHANETMLDTMIDDLEENYESLVGHRDGASKINARYLADSERINGWLSAVREQLKKNPGDKDAKKLESQIKLIIQRLKKSTQKYVKLASDAEILTDKYQKMLDETRILISKYAASGSESDKLAAKNKLVALQKSTKADEVKVKEGTALSKFIEKVKMFTKKSYDKLNNEPKTNDA